MGKQYEKLSEEDKAFIAKQKIFFIASHSSSETNLSPRGYDCLRVTGDNEVLFLDYVGSGNRTARDIRNDGEVTVMFCAFEGNPKILRLFCKGELIDCGDEKARSLFDDDALKGMRRFVKLHIYCIEHSCGMSVPFFDYKKERPALKDFCAKAVDNGKLESLLEKYDSPPNLNSFKKYKTGF